MHISVTNLKAKTLLKIIFWLLLGVFITTYLALNYKLYQQQQLTTIYKKELNTLENLTLEQQNLISSIAGLKLKMSELKTLSTNIRNLYQMLNIIAKCSNRKVYLKTFNYTTTLITICAVATTENNIAEFIQSLKKDSIISSLLGIKKLPNSTQLEFTLHLTTNK